MTLAPISRLGIEAIAARIVHSANRQKKLKYFAPVAQTPGFPRALANTIAELRLQIESNPEWAQQWLGTLVYSQGVTGLRRGENEAGLEDLRSLPGAIRAAGEKVLHVTRFKGLGEMNAEELRETTLDPTNRTLLQVRMDDVGAADNLFRVLMGDQVEPRREFIQKHALDVRNLEGTP